MPHQISPLGMEGDGRRRCGDDGAILGISGAGATGGGLSGVRRNYPGGSLARGAGVLGGNGGAFNGLIYPS